MFDVSSVHQPLLVAYQKSIGPFTLYQNIGCIGSLRCNSIAPLQCAAIVVICCLSVVCRRRRRLRRECIVTR